VTAQERSSPSARRTLVEVLRNPDLRRLELAWGASVASEWAFVIAIAVFAYHDGGATAVGAVGLIRMLPAAVATPFAGLPGDRYPRELVLLMTHVARAATMAGAAAAAFSGAPPVVVYALTGLLGILVTPVIPAHTALVPALVQTPRELTATNLASATIEGLGTLLGPVLAALLLAVSGVGLVFLTSAFLIAAAAALVFGIRGKSRWEPVTARSGGVVRETFAGFQTIGLRGDVRLLVTLWAAQTLVRGALNVLIVVAALDLLDLGKSGVGALTSAIGAGGLLGATLALRLVGRHRLAAPFGAGIVLWGAPIALIGIWPNQVAAFVLLAIVGVGNTFVDVAGFTLLQRAVPDQVLSRVVGALMTIAVTTLGLGAILTPLVIPGLGVRGTLIATGALLPTLAALLWRALRRIDAASLPGDEVELLGSIAIFAPLPRPTLEGLAARLIPLEVVADYEVVRQGDKGDRFYVIADGEADVTIDGSRTGILRGGDYFGEIALLRDSPRTATVTARTAAKLYALERDDFIGTVTGNVASASAADTAVRRRLGSFKPGIASV
jgi:MFS family permease